METLKDIPRQLQAEILSLVKGAELRESAADMKHDIYWILREQFELPEATNP